MAYVQIADAGHFVIREYWEERLKDSFSSGELDYTMQEGEEGRPETDGLIVCESVIGDQTALVKRMTDTWVHNKPWH